MLGWTHIRAVSSGCTLMPYAVSTIDREITSESAKGDSPLTSSSHTPSTPSHTFIFSLNFLDRLGGLDRLIEAKVPVTVAPRWLSQ